MNKKKQSFKEYIAGGILIFLVGIFIGNQLNLEKITSIQGYLYTAVIEASDANASDANISNVNASDSNASDANASDANASDANASDANASNANATDNIIHLQSFSLGKTIANMGDKVNIKISTTGACNSGASIVFKSNTGETFTAKVENITSNPYIIIPKNIIPATYSITDVLLVGKNSNNTTFTKQYNKSNFKFKDTITISSNNNTKIVLKSLTLSSNSAKLGDKIYINLETNEKLSGLKLVFTSSDNKSFTVYTQDITGTKPYIELPSSASTGTYNLTTATLMTENSSTTYSKSGVKPTEKFAFNVTIEISEVESTYIYNNEDINQEILTKLYNSPSGTEIKINADANTFINEELFNTIKGTNKKLIINYKGNQIIFNGNDIKNVKTIDINMTVDSVSSNDSIKQLVPNGVIVSFPDNGNLPGKTLVRIKVTEEITTLLNNKVHIYVYNEDTNDFCVIDTNVKKSADGYYEFTITHNSNYLLVNEKLDSGLVVESKDVVSFQKSNKTYLMLIIIGLLIIAATTVLILTLNKKEKKKKTK